MKHKEWLGKRELIEQLLKQAGLTDTKEAGIRKQMMRCVIWCKYVEMMTIEETYARIHFKFGIDISVTTYYRLLNKAIELMEENS